MQCLYNFLMISYEVRRKPKLLSYVHDFSSRMMHEREILSLPAEYITEA